MTNEMVYKRTDFNPGENDARANELYRNDTSAKRYSNDSLLPAYQNIRNTNKICSIQIETQKSTIYLVIFTSCMRILNARCLKGIL